MTQSLMENVRIDKGLKKGPRMRSGIPTRPSHPSDLGTWHIPEGLNPDDVIDRYMTEATTSQIAKEYGISRKALTKWLREQRPKQWKQAQIVRALAMKEDSEDGIQYAPDPLSLARARELLKAAQFDLTALDPDYRPKVEQEITIDHHITIDNNLEDSTNRLIEKAKQRVIDVTPSKE